MDAIMSSSSQRCKVVFEGCAGTSARHYLLVAKEGQRFHELCGKILLDCKHLKLDQHKELASLSWKDSDEDIVNVDCEDAFQAAVSYIVPDQAGFCVLRLFAKFRPKAAVAASPTKVAPKARVEQTTRIPSRVKVPDESPEKQVSGGMAVKNTTTVTSSSPLKATPVRAQTLLKKVAKMVKPTPVVSVSEFACPRCPQVYPTEIQLNGHLSCHTQETSTRPSTICPECGVKCKSQETLAKHDCHIAAVRKQKQKRRRMGMGMGMGIGKSVRVPLTMAAAPATATSTATAAELALKRICDKCGTRCKTDASYATHDCHVSEMRREDKRKSVRKVARGAQKRSQKCACSHCGRVLKTKSALGSHLRKCSAAAAAGGPSKSPDSFVCEPACGKWYGSRTSLWKHRRLCDFAKASMTGNGGSGEPSNSGATCEMVTRRSTKKADTTENGGETVMAVGVWDTEQLGGGVVSSTDNAEKESSPEIDVGTSNSGSSGRSQPTSPVGPDSRYQIQINQGPYGAFKVEVPFHMVDFGHY